MNSLLSSSCDPLRKVPISHRHNPPLLDEGLNITKRTFIKLKKKNKNLYSVSILYRYIKQYYDLCVHKNYYIIDRAKLHPYCNTINALMC
jgi:hypothetical protein